jgi:hypothetical protein
MAAATSSMSQREHGRSPKLEDQVPAERPLMVALASEHRLAQSKHVSLDSLREEQLRPREAKGETLDVTHRSDATE